MQFTGDKSLTIDLIFTPGTYEAGTVSYLFAKSVTGNITEITVEAQSTDGLEGLSAVPELVPTEDGLLQLMIKLTVSKPFTVTETAEVDDNKSPYSSYGLRIKQF